MTGQVRFDYNSGAFVVLSCTWSPTAANYPGAQGQRSNEFQWTPAESFSGGEPSPNAVEEKPPTPPSSTPRGPDKAPPQGPITYTHPDPHRSRWWYSPGVQPVGQDPRPARDRRPERVRDAKQPSRGEMCAATGFASVSSKMGATR